jgi:hypothetical protein
MMPEMIYVITHQIFERGRLIFRHRHKRDFIQVMLVSRLRARAFGDGRENV